MHSSSDYQKALQGESVAFDHQIIERIQNGHIPDLQRSGRCNWFYNNVWRDQEYANLFYGETVKQITEAIKLYIPKPASQIHILEIACGPGHITLELARKGFQITGVDLSPQAIEVARKVASEDPFCNSRGELTYFAGNIYDLDETKLFDVIVFSNALHHFENLDSILSKVNTLLKTGGIIFASEPTREKMSDGDALLVYLIKELLAVGKIYYKSFGLPETPEQLKSILEEIKNDFGYKDSKGENIQSPLDNEGSFSTMYPALKIHFEEISLQMDFAFFDRVIGGLRLGSVEEEHKIARWLAMIDKLLCKEKNIAPEQFHFIGRKKQLIS